MTTYYAVCDVNGPISRAIEADTLEQAVEQFEQADLQSWIDEPAADAEDDLDIEGDGMSEAEFDAALRAAGCKPVRDLASIHSYHGGTTSHLAGGWYLWEADAASKLDYIICPIDTEHFELADPEGRMAEDAARNAAERRGWDASEAKVIHKDLAMIDQYLAANVARKRVRDAGEWINAPPEWISCFVVEWDDVD